MDNDELRELQILIAKFERTSGLQVMASSCSDKRAEQLYHQDREYFVPLEIHLDCKLNG